jgi:hypothetical protein
MMGGERRKEVPIVDKTSFYAMLHRAQALYDFPEKDFVSPTSDVYFAFFILIHLQLNSIL